jgi:pyruvate/2-oxoglutarate dehydrogenase complex dihydrolipoamide acyltransferase (E2) component
MKTDILLEAYDVNDTSAFLFNYAFNNGDYVEKGEILLNTETSKNVHEVISTVSGYVLYAYAEGDEAPVGEVIISIFDMEDAYNEHIMQSELNNTAGNISNVVATEKAKDLAKKHDLDISLIAKEGVIKETDVINYIANMGGGG